MHARKLSTFHFPLSVYHHCVKKLLIILAIILIGAVAWYQFSLRPADSSDTVRRAVEIRSGLSVRDIGSLLQQKSIIRSPLAFSLYARFHGSQNALQAGDFSLQPSMTVPQIMDALRKGYSEEVSVTIPEGFTVKDIDTLLTKKGLIKEGEFALCAQTCDLSGFEFLPIGAALAKRGGRVEGYLFPDTYSVFSQKFRAEDFLKRLLETFRKRVVTGLAPDVAASKRSLHEIVTMASLIEEETKTVDERPVVAGILWKRFEAKQGLGVDATIRYVLDKPTEAITAKDLDVDSPYNLRKYRGLPPGPIANAGLASITAALHPIDSKYWYYLHGKDAMIHYAETNDEHNRNKALYLP